MILIFGPPGSGKTTQSKMLEKNCGLKWLGAGQLLRDKNDLNIASQMQKGELLDSEVVNKIIAKAISVVDSRDTLVIDGYPRTIDQAKWINENKVILKREIKAVIVLEANNDEIFRRLNLRNRIDDNPEVVSKRIIQYKKEVTPIIDYYSQLGLEILRIEGSSKPELVHDNIVDELKNRKIL